MKREISIGPELFLNDVIILLKRILKILYERSVQTPIYQIKTQLKANYISVRRVFDIVQRALLNIKKKKISGPGFIVEIDETSITKRKYDTRRPVPIV